MRWTSVWLSLIILSFFICRGAVSRPGLSARLWKAGAMVWNEPEISYRKGVREEYYSLYDHVADAVERALPLVRGAGGGERCLCWYGNGKGGDALTIALM